ncbi:stress response protein NST1-like isoform X2 [Osmia bicornis bicornis]|uniref:stress response protein NST1-like isoform X2 n=1 Tax=Osmia bicornis bicornis TaxID=1437191 RepID=UPI001EAF178F|nr:stress response protein NST1-like isoform X2 [Osmia bicornis bicornis]
MKEHKSISNDKLVSLEDGLIPNIETSYVKRMVRTTNGCKQLVQCIKFLLYFELLLFVGWAFYTIMETYTVESMEHKITDSIRDSESHNSHSRQLPYEETTIIPSNFLAEMENLLQTEKTLEKTLEEQFNKQLHSVETGMNFVTTTEEPNLKKVEEDNIRAKHSPLLVTKVPRLLVEELEKDFETNESESLLPIEDALEKILKEQFKKHSVETDMNFVTTTEEPNSKKVEEDHIKAARSPLLMTNVPKLVVEELEKDFETNESESLLPIEDALEKILKEQFKKHSVETDMNFVTTTEEPNSKKVEEDHIKAARSPLLMTNVPKLVVEELDKDFETNESESLLPIENALQKTLEEQFKKQLHSIETDMNFVTTTEEPISKKVEEDHIKAARSPLLMTNVPKLVVEELDKDFETNESESLLPIENALQKTLEEQFKKQLHSIDTDMNFVTTTEEPNSKKVEGDHIKAARSPLLMTNVPKLVVEELEKDFETNESESLLPIENALQKTLEEQFKKQLHSIETDMNFVTTTEEPNSKKVEEDHIKAARSPLLVTNVPKLLVEEIEKDFETNYSESLSQIENAFDKILDELFNKQLHSGETNMNFDTTRKEPNLEKVEEDHIRAKHSPLLVTSVPRLVVEELEKDLETNESEDTNPDSSKSEDTNSDSSKSEEPSLVWNFGFLPFPNIYNIKAQSESSPNDSDKSESTEIVEELLEMDNHRATDGIDKETAVLIDQILLSLILQEARRDGQIMNISEDDMNPKLQDSTFGEQFYGMDGDDTRLMTSFQTDSGSEDWKDDSVYDDIIINRSVRENTNDRTPGDFNEQNHEFTPMIGDAKSGETAKQNFEPDMSSWISGTDEVYDPPVFTGADISWAKSIDKRGISDVSMNQELPYMRVENVEGFDERLVPQFPDKLNQNNVMSRLRPEIAETSYRRR